MWIIRWILVVIVVFILVGFAMQNASVSVPVRFFKWETIRDLPLWLVMYLSFIAGTVFWLIISIFQIIILKRVTRQWQKKAKNLENELNRLRNVSVEDTVLPEQPDAKELKQAY